MFYPLYLKAFLAGRQAPDLLPHDNESTLFSCSSLVPEGCVFVCVCVYAVHAHALVCGI